MLTITNHKLLCSLQFQAFFNKLKLKFATTAKRNKSELSNLFSLRVLGYSATVECRTTPSIALIPPSIILRVAAIFYRLVPYSNNTANVRSILEGFSIY